LYTLDEKMCKQNVELNVKRDKDERFTVSLPFRDNISKLGKSLSHMEITQHTIPDEQGQYLPHHAVRNESSTSTIPRVVFDA